MIKNIKLLTLSSILLSATLLFANTANENISVTADADQNKISSAEMDQGFSEETMNDWFSDFENKYNTSFGIAKNGRTFFNGVAIVRVGPKDPAYAKELAIAYDKAVLDLQTNFIMQTYGKMSTERILDFLEDDSTNAQEFSKDEVENAKKNLKTIKQQQAFLDKALNAISNMAGLNNKLVELGADQQKLEGMTVNQKKQLFKDNFKRSMIKKAVHNMSGLVPIQTKVLATNAGNGTAVQLGVIAVQSEKTVQFAEDISRGRDTLIRGKARSIKDVLPKNEAAYLDEFGLRYIYDEEGKPMLLSYGRWSVTQKNDDPAKTLRKIQSAQDKAQMYAEAYIGEFMKTNIQASQGSTAESISEDIATKITELDGDGNELGSNESLEKIGETIDKTFKKVKASANFKLRGTSKIKNWQQKDENGILHVGTVVTWTYSQLDNANNMDEKKFRSNQELKKSNTYKVQTRTSNVVNDENDF